MQDMIILILATDMARHAEILDNFKQKLDKLFRRSGRRTEQSDGTQTSPPKQVNNIFIVM